jgi:hypothetical protein
MKSLSVAVVLCCLCAVGVNGGRAYLEARMKTIIFEKIDFRSIEFSDAVEYLRFQSKELDPQKKGINIILKKEGGQNPKLTLQLGRTSLHRALKTITDIADYRWRFIGNNLMLEPIPPSKPKKKESGKTFLDIE